MKIYLKKVFCDRETYLLTIILIPILCILLCLDYKDIVINYIISTDWKLYLIAAIGVIILGLVFFCGNHYSDLFKKIITVNILDRFLFLLIISEAVYLCSLILIHQAYTYKCVILMVSFVIFVGVILYRLFRYSKHKKATSQNDSQVCDIKQLLDAETATELNYPILISEKDVDYDLFERNVIVFQLENAIDVSCKSDMPFVIGLSGEWGTGKTTILNIVKKDFIKNEEIIIIDNFDPWKYASPKAMLIGMYYTILKNTGVRYSDRQVKELLSTACDIVAGTGSKIGKIGTIAKALLSQEGNNDSVEVLKSKIDEYLELNNKTILFMIDNLDRVNAENIIFLFKLVGAVFDFKRVKYLLSYDKERLCDIFRDSLQIDPRYVEKIINQELVVPKISVNSRYTVYKTCINNMLLSYGVDAESLSDFEFITDFIIDNVQDIRKFKRLLNSAFFISFGKNSLYKPDLLTLEIVRFLDIELYESIYNNKEYFIDVDTDYDVNIYKASFKTKEFNENCKSFFESIFENKNQIMQLLTNIFPYVNRYAENHDIKPEGYSGSGDYKKTQLFSRVNSVKYFDLYFCNSLNAFSEFSVEFNDSLKQILSLQESKISDEFTKYVTRIPNENHYEWALKLYLFKEDINEIAAYPILISLYKNIQIINDERGFFRLSPRERIYAVMTDLFKKIGTEKQELFVTNHSGEINKLFVITNMINLLKESGDEAIKSSLNNWATSICDKIFDENINIYDDAYYSHDNIWSVYQTIKNNDNKDTEQIIKAYISNILTPKVIYRVLRDTVGCSIGRQYGYYIVKKEYNLLFDEKTNIQSILVENPPQNQSEGLIYNLYEDYVKYDGNMHPEHERWFDKPVNFIL